MQDPALIKVAGKKLELAVAKKEKTRKGKSNGGKKAGKYILRNVIIHYFTHAKSLTMSIFCNIIFSCTKGSVTAAESFEVLLSHILQSENRGADFEETLQELKEWPFQGVPKEKGTRKGEKKLYEFQKKRRVRYNSLLEKLAIVPTENDSQKKQASYWIKELNKRLTSIKTEWERLKAS